LIRGFPISTLPLYAGSEAADAEKTRLSVLARCVFAIGVLLSSACPAQSGRGLEVVIKNGSGRPVPLYTNSYALVIGVSRYTNGWPTLESISSEIGKISAALKEQGFEVETVMDPDGARLKKAFNDFIEQYGYNKDNRLLFFTRATAIPTKTAPKATWCRSTRPTRARTRKGSTKRPTT
jgi:hypothetical protein